MPTLLLWSLLLSLPSFAADAPAKVADQAKCDDTNKVYKVCGNQEEIYGAALKKAKAEKKQLVVVIGAEWCPWCLSLHHMLGDKSIVTADIAKKYSFVDVALYQAKEKLPTGLAVQEKLKTQAGFKGKLAGIPVLAVVNPKNGKTELVDTEPLEKNTETSKGHDSAKVLAAIDKAAQAVR